ncbi:MAG: hypothetical protein ACJAU3_001889 [Zhongshania sp.]
MLNDSGGEVMTYFSLHKIQVSIAILLALKSINIFANDVDLARLKTDALHVNTEIKQNESKNCHIYIGSSAESLILQAAKIQIDDNQVVRYTYSEMESKALLAGGLHTINSLNLSAGEHRVRAEFVAMGADAGPNSDRIFPKIDQHITVGNSTYIELELISDGMTKMRGNAEIVMRDWQPAL